MRVIIKQHHINNGLKNNLHDNPIALAIKENSFNHINVEIGKHFAWVNHDKFYLS